MDGLAVLVIGAGRSGVAAAGALLRRGAVVTVLESGEGETVRAAAASLADDGARVVTAVSDVDVRQFDVVVPSPGVPEHHTLLVTAAADGVDIWSEPELAWRLADGQTELVGVTGTNGKTTTTELLSACLDVPAAGNIGTPLVSLLEHDPPPLVVAELSSFQLRFAQTLRPRVAVLLNVAPDHLDWHGSLDAYQAAKARLWARQQPGDTTVFNADDTGAREVLTAYPPPAATLGFTAGAPDDGQVGVDNGVVVVRQGGTSAPVVNVADLQVTGPHNVANVCAAVGGAVAAGADPATLAPALQSYNAGAHRLEAVATVGGVDYVNDSKATNPHAAAAALASFGDGRVIWIAGGLGKGLVFGSLAPLVRRHVKAAVTIGTSGPDIADMARGVGVHTVAAGTLDIAVTAAADLAEPGDTVLLSPACASMDQFTDYAERGQTFRTAVHALSRDAQGAGHGR